MIQFRRILSLFRASGLILLTCVYFVLFASTRAQAASTGCLGIHNLAVTPADGTANTNFFTGDFEAGETIQLTKNSGATTNWRLSLFAGAGNQNSALDTSNPKTLTIAATEAGITFRIGKFFDSFVGTATCLQAVTTTTTTTPTDSTNVQTLQNNITTTVANASGVVISNAIDGGIGLGFSDGGAPTNFGPNGGFINFAAEPKSEIQNRTDEAFSALAYAGGVNKAPNFNKAPPRLDREWSAWADIRGTGWKVNEANGNGNDIKGNQINLTAGLGRKLTADTLVGVVVGYENFKYDVASLNGSLKGNGETIGGYFAQRFGNNLRFDAALAWTYLNYSASSGSASGSFNAGRWLATTGLTGNHKFGSYTLEPSAKLFVLWEREKAWTDSLGTAQASRNFSAGRTALGSKVARSFTPSGGWTITPYVGLYGDWRFSSDSAIATGTPVAFIKNGWSGRVTTGVSATAQNGCTVSLGGEYGGLGANFKVWTGNVRVSVPFGAQARSR